MPTTIELQADPLRRGTKVRLVTDIRGYPAGSLGRIAVANGMTWKRYWVRMHDGEAVGHVDHDSLVRAKDYDAFLMAAEREAEETETARNAPNQADSGDTSIGGGSAGGVEVNGVLIPQHLLDRSAAARARLGG